MLKYLSDLLVVVWSVCSFVRCVLCLLCLLLCEYFVVFARLHIVSFCRRCVNMPMIGDQPINPNTHSFAPHHIQVLVCTSHARKDKAEEGGAGWWDKGE